MNSKQLLMNQLQSQLSRQNPKLFQQYMQMKNQNPQEVLNLLTSKYTPEQMEQFRQYLRGFGIREDQLQQYGINRNV